MFLFYIGALIPDLKEFRNEAFSRAGNLIQENIIRHIGKSGIKIGCVLSQYPMMGFPRSRIVFNRLRKINCKTFTIHFIPFINIPWLRPISVSIALLIMMFYYSVKYIGHRKIVLTFNLTEPPGLATLLISKLINAKSVAAIYDINIPGQTVPNKLARKIDYWIQKKIIRWFDGLIVVSESIIKDFAPSSKYICVPGGISQEIINRTKDRLKISKKDDLFSIVFAGSLDKVNGINEIIQAFSLIKDERLRLIIAGDGPLKKDIMRAATLDARIFYVGFVDQKKVFDLYDKADVLINMRLTNKINTKYFFPSKLIEYMASGVPTITTHVNGVERFKNFLFIMNDDEPQTLANMIISLSKMSKCDLREIGLRAFNQVAKEFSWDEQGRKIVEFLDSI